VARQTLRRAREVLEATPHAPRHAQMLEEAEANARGMATERIASLEQEIKTKRDAALRELTEVRDAYESLARNERLSAPDYSKELYTLRERQQAAEAQLARAEELLGTVEEIEQDPLGWFDDLATRQPRLLPEFPW
jgi:hypothetical protein